MQKQKRNTLTVRFTRTPHRKPMSELTVVKLSPEIGLRLKVEAAIRGITMRQLVEQLLEEHLSVKMPKAQPDSPTAKETAAPRRPRKARKT